MPYTKSTKERPHSMQKENPKDVGELTLAITLVALDYLKHFEKKSYAVLCGIMGAFSRVEAGKAIPREHRDPSNPGQLAGKLAKVIERYIQKKTLPPLAEEIKGVVRCASMEFYHRVVRPYEDLKIKENGDVFPVAIPVEVKKAGRPKKEEKNNDKESV